MWLWKNCCVTFHKVVWLLARRLIHVSSLLQGWNSLVPHFAILPLEFYLVVVRYNSSLHMFSFSSWMIILVILNHAKKILRADWSLSGYLLHNLAFGHKRYKCALWKLLMCSFPCFTENWNCYTYQALSHSSLLFVERRVKSVPNLQ